MLEPTPNPKPSESDSQALPFETTKFEPPPPADEPWFDEREAQRQQLDVSIARGVSWMHWAIGLSVLNALTAAAGAEWSFALAMSSSLVPAIVMHQIAAEAGMAWLNIIGVALAMVPPALLFGLVWLGRRDKPWALMAAMVVYGGDAGLSLVFEDWLGVILHAVCLWFTFSAWSAATEKRALSR